MHNTQRISRAPITVKDIARAAGVSVATVSRALNNPGRVNEETATRVRAVAAKLNYIPSRAAGSLVSKRFKAIGAIMPTIENPIFAKALHALQAQLNEDGYNLLVASTNYDLDQEATALQSLLEHGVDAIVFVGYQRRPNVADMLERTGVPFVNTWVYDPKSPLPCIGLDNHAAMARMAGYLLDLGHRDFAVIAGITEQNDRAAQRKAGALQALRQRGVEVRPDRVIESPYSIAAGRSSMRRILAQGNPPTAVICGNDVLAFGAVYECLAQGIAVPQEISITGFDDFELASHMMPALTTIRVPATEMGEGAARYLVSVLENQPTNLHTEFEAELIVRASAAPPRATASAKTGSNARSM